MLSEVEWDFEFVSGLLGGRDLHDVSGRDVHARALEGQTDGASEVHKQGHTTWHSVETLGIPYKRAYRPVVICCALTYVALSARPAAGRETEARDGGHRAARRRCEGRRRRRRGRRPHITISHYCYYYCY